MPASNASSFLACAKRCFRVGFAFANFFRFAFPEPVDLALRLFDRGSCIDTADYLVLPLFSRRRRAHANDWRRPGRRLHLSLYITLRQQDYALLMGAIALFIVLAIVMYVTRKVDWYARDASQG